MGAMDLIKVGMIGLKAFEAGFRLFDDVPARDPLTVGIGVVHGEVDFGSEEHSGAFPISFERFAGELFADSSGIRVGGVDDIDPGIEGAIDDFDRVVDQGRLPNIIAPRVSGETLIPVRPKRR